MPQALEIIEKLLESEPDNFSYLYEKGRIKFISGDFETAEKFFLNALKNGHQDKFKIYLQLGKCFQERELWGNSKACYTRACEVAPKSSIAWLGLGVACLKRKDFGDSETALTQANLFDFRNATIWGYLALLALQDGGQMEKAN